LIGSMSLVAQEQLTLNVYDTASMVIRDGEARYYEVADR
jgi:hypothetical protein